MITLRKHGAAVVGLSGFIAGADDPRTYQTDKGADLIKTAHDNPGGDMVAAFTNSRGIWQGGEEPSHLFSMQGEWAAIEEWARALGEKYVQQAVAVFYSDPAGADRLAAIPCADEVAAGILAGRANLANCTISDNYLIIMGRADEVAADLDQVADAGGRVDDAEIIAGRFSLVDTATPFSRIVNP